MAMFMAVLTVEFSLEGNDNLKAKRRVANSLKQKTRNKFNVAIAEAGTEDSLSRLRLQWYPFPTARAICAAAWTNARS